VIKINSYPSITKKIKDNNKKRMSFLLVNSALILFFSMVGFIIGSLFF